jgi:hypothetical protein
MREVRMLACTKPAGPARPAAADVRREPGRSSDTIRWRDLPLWPDLVDLVDVEVAADQGLQLTDDVIHVGHVVFSGLRELEPQSHSRASDLYAHGKSVRRNLPKGGLDGLSHDVIVPDRRPPWVLWRWQAHGVHAGLKGTTLGDPVPLMPYMDGPGSGSRAGSGRRAARSASRAAIQALIWAILSPLSTTFS